MGNLFLAMLKSGLLGYGGGPASIPIIQSQVVETYH
ncbi:MAG: chromate transporter, partial [Firmicutes bacterium]|nr:chromate transporter [Bacillota bacterium]